MPASQIYAPISTGCRVYVRFTSASSGGSTNIMLGNDIALHVNIRYNENALVLNTCVGGKWGGEERPAGFPLDPNGKDTYVSIWAGADGFYIQASIVGSTQKPFIYKYAYRMTGITPDHVYTDWPNLTSLTISQF